MDNLVVEVEEFHFKRTGLSQSKVIVSFAGHQSGDVHRGLVAPTQRGFKVSRTGFSTGVRLHGSVLDVLTGGKPVFGHFSDDGVRTRLCSATVFEVEIPLGQRKAFRFLTQGEFQINLGAGLARS